MSSQHHYIETQQLEFRLSDVDDVNDFLSTVSARYQENILPALSKLFEKMTSPDETILIDCLSIDIGHISFEEWETQLIEEIAKRVQQSISNIRNDSGASITTVHNNPLAESNDDDSVATRTTTDEALLRSFIFFLQHGYLNSRILEHASTAMVDHEAKTSFRDVSDALEKRILLILQVRPELRQILLNELSTSIVLMQRLVKQFSEPFCHQLIGYLTTNNSESVGRRHILKKLLEVIEKTISHTTGSQLTLTRRLLDFSHALNLPLSYTRAHLKEYFSHFASLGKIHPLPIIDLILETVRAGSNDSNQEIAVEKFKTDITELKQFTESRQRISLPVNEIKSQHRSDPDVVHTASIQQRSQENPIAPPIEKEEVLEEAKAIFVDNAGIALLSPFLPAFFRQLGLLGENQVFTSDDSATRAAHLLHYLATGKENCREYDLVLPKLFCGLSTDIPITREVELSEGEKNESADLLQSVIRHWSILGNTSPDGLRETFLVRSGKLELSAEEIKLIVEAKSVDMLMKHLPWSISFIRFPWLNRIITIEWCN